MRPGNNIRTCSMRREVVYCTLASVLAVIASTVTAQSGRRTPSTGDRVGQRQTRGDSADAVKPLTRIDNRLDTRLDTRLANRIERDNTTQADALTPFGNTLKSVEQTQEQPRQ